MRTSRADSVSAGTGPGRRDIEDDAGAARLGERDGREGLAVGDLALQHEDVAGTEAAALELGDTGGPIGARGDDDGVLGLGVDGDQRHGGRLADHRHMGEVDPRLLHDRDGERGEAVIAARGDMQGVGPGARRGDGLVGALRAGHHDIALAQDGFAGMRDVIRHW